MFRHTKVGLALAAALQELRDEGEHTVTSAMEDVIWRCFERTMQLELAAVPQSHTALVQHTFQSSQETTMEESKKRARTSGGDDGALAAMDLSDEDNLRVSRAVQRYPAYRVVDDHTSILFKNATVTVTEGKKEYVFDVDYLLAEKGSSRK